MSLTCLNVSQRRLNSFTSPRILHRPNQFLLWRLEIVQFLWVMKSRTLGSQLTAFSLLKLTLTTIVTDHLKFYSSHRKKNKKLLSRSTTERLFHAFFYSKLDYCNSILHGLPSYEVEKLQRLHNTAARLTVRAKESAHITSILKSLHWLLLK